MTTADWDGNFFVLSWQQWVWRPIKRGKFRAICELSWQHRIVSFPQLTHLSVESDASLFGFKFNFNFNFAQQKTLKFSCGKLWPYSTRFLSIDLTALGFPVTTLLYRGVNFFNLHLCKPKCVQSGTMKNAGDIVLQSLQLLLSMNATTFFRLLLFSSNSQTSPKKESCLLCLAIQY